VTVQYNRFIDKRYSHDSILRQFPRPLIERLNLEYDYFVIRPPQDFKGIKRRHMLQLLHHISQRLPAASGHFLSHFHALQPFLMQSPATHMPPSPR
jgi:hypothetical protein